MLFCQQEKLRLKKKAVCLRPHTKYGQEPRSQAAEARYPSQLLSKCSGAPVQWQVRCSSEGLGGKPVLGGACVSS